MLPCAIRRRSASGVMSTSSTCSARRTTSSGTVSRCGTPVICSTTSLSDSRCWMLTVVRTVMPASSSSSMSCQRLALREPGTLVWASSSTSTTSGARARTASRSISVKVDAAVGRASWRGTTSRLAEHGLGEAAGRGSRRSRRRRRCRGRCGGGPLRASCTSCRRRGRPRGRRAAVRVPCARSFLGAVRPTAQPWNGYCWSRARLSSQHVDRRLADEAEDPAGRVLVDQLR